MTNHIIALVAGLTMISSLSYSATAEQAGTYTGTIKGVFTGESGKVVEKTAMKIEIAEDNTTTITIAGDVQQIGAGGFFNATTGVVIYGLPTGGPTSSFFLAEFSFKGSAIKGSSTGVIVSVGPPVAVAAAVETKFKLKKQ